jgi:hypothetical protein
MNTCNCFPRESSPNKNQILNLLNFWKSQIRDSKKFLRPFRNDSESLITSLNGEIARQKVISTKTFPTFDLNDLFENLLSTRTRLSKIQESIECLQTRAGLRWNTDLPPFSDHFHNSVYKCLPSFWQRKFFREGTIDFGTKGAVEVVQVGNQEQFIWRGGFLNEEIRLPRGPRMFSISNKE